MAAGKKPPVREGLRVCVFMGIACHDVMVARLIYEKATAMKVGQWLKM